jgi:hypothetical protein
MKTIGYVLLFITVVFINTDQLFGQEKVNISVGVGFPEVINLGMRYQINQSQIGASIGWWPGNPDAFLFNWENILSFSGDYYYHFGGSSKFSDLRPW